MKNKAFTVIELLVIIALLGGIAIVSYNSVFQKVEESYYSSLENGLLLSGNDYFQDHRKELPISGYSVVSVSDLISSNYTEQLKDRSGNNCNSGKVFVYKGNTGYEYEVCLECGNYKSEGNYCKGNIPGIIVSGKRKSNNMEYNPLLSYSSVEVLDNDIAVISLDMKYEEESTETLSISRYVVRNINTGEEKTCNATNNKCSLEIDNSGSFIVTAYNGATKVGEGKNINVRIDKESPTFSLEAEKEYTIEDNSDKKEVVVYVRDVKDDYGIRSIKYRVDEGEEKNLIDSYEIREDITSGKNHIIEVTVEDLSGKKITKSVTFDVSYLI